jgi:hypothetical protein
VIQFASEDAFQVHSAWVLTATVAVAPAEPIDAAGGVTVTPHLVGEGPVDDATVEPHPAEAQATHTMRSEAQKWTKWRSKDIGADEEEQPSCLNRPVVFLEESLYHCRDSGQP